jgi:predicted GIY-YIG superfamily endonuclease
MHGCKLLVWYELHDSMIEAIARETNQGRQPCKEVGFD